MKVMVSLYGTKLLLAIIRWVWKPRFSSIKKLNEHLSFKDQQHVISGM
jgi:hypothetical protein